MATNIIIENGKTIVKTAKRIDTISAGEFEKAITPLLTQENADVVFDCSELGYISSSGLRVVLKAQKIFSANKGKLKLIGVKAEIKKIFDMTGFSRILDIEEK